MTKGRHVGERGDAGGNLSGRTARAVRFYPTIEHRFVQPALQDGEDGACGILCLPWGHLGVTNAPHGLG